MKVQQQGADSWICARLQPEGDAELAGGKFIVAHPNPAVGQDDNYSACPAETSRSGHLGDPSDPPYVPYTFGAYANDETGAAWVCLQAGLGARAMFNGAGTEFSPDDGTEFSLDRPGLAALPSPSAPSPPRTPWTPGKASADCETQSGGSPTQLVNAQIAGTQVWLDAWQSGSKVQLCVRAAGASTAGGRLALDATGAPGVTPVLTQGTNAGVCTTDVFTDDQDQLYIRRSSTSANPASVCVTKGTTSQRFTVGFTGTPTPPLPNWIPDD